MGLQALSQGDILKRLHHAGIAGPVQASLVLDAFRLYLRSEFPDVTTEECDPLFLRGPVLVVRSINPALMQRLRDQEPNITAYLNQACGATIERLQFRAN